MKKIAIITAYILSIAVTTSMTATISYAQPYGKGIYNANVPYGNQTSLTISTNGNVKIPITPTSTGTQVTGTSTVTVTSTDVTGYRLFIRSLNNTYMDNFGATLPTSNNSVPSPLATNTWGYNLDASNNFVGITLADVLIRSTTVPAKNGDMTNITYGMKLDLSKPAGNYTNDIIYTAVPQTEDTVCPVGFIVVPGSATYGTANFCVMKYEAKNAGNNIPVSQAAGTPWINIYQDRPGSNNDAKEFSQNVVGCTGCHLITDGEWLTIAQNILSVPSNWSGGAVGSGYVYSGHNDNAPANALDADTNDSNGYYGETNTGGSQRRTLTLTNGEVIWDFAGNVWEWTSGQLAGDQQPGIPSLPNQNQNNWNDSLLTLRGLPSYNLPSYGTPAASNWTYNNGIGSLWSQYSDTLTTIRGLTRGGHYSSSSSVAGIYALSTTMYANDNGTTTGFRVAR